MARMAMTTPSSAPKQKPIALPAAAPVAPAPSRTRPMLAVVSTALSEVTSRKPRTFRPIAANTPGNRYSMLCPSTAKAISRMGQNRSWFP